MWVVLLELLALLKADASTRISRASHFRCTEHRPGCWQSRKMRGSRSSNRRHHTTPPSPLHNSPLRPQSKLSRMPHPATRHQSLPHYSHIPSEKWPTLHLPFAIRPGR